ncbi:hypothetical protein BC332_15788 [Capsicum chinense]|nr:hypothetical protein BC332_15788 [Capsicum chinense]
MNGMNELRSLVKCLMEVLSKLELLEDYNRTPSRESEVKFQISKVTVLKHLLKFIAYINEQLSAPANWVVVINLKVCGAKDKRLRVKEPVRMPTKTIMFPNYNLRSRGKPFRFAALPTLNLLELLRGNHQGPPNSNKYTNVD